MKPKYSLFQNNIQGSKPTPQHWKHFTQTLSCFLFYS
jgi:hypothetical protein